MTDINSGSLTLGKQLLAVCIASKLSDHRNVCAKARDLHGLIGALTARSLLEVDSQDGFAFLGEDPCRHDLIHHKTADDEDIRITCHMTHNLFAAA